MSEKNQIVVVLIVALFLGALLDRSMALKIVAGVVLLDIAEKASGLRVYPEAVLVRTETAFGSGVPRRRNNF